MPFNVSNPVLYYNKKAFPTAGLDPEQAADDARRGEAAAEKLKDCGAVTQGRASG